MVLSTIGRRFESFQVHFGDDSTFPQTRNTAPLAQLDNASAYGAEDSRFESWGGVECVERAKTVHFSLAGVVVTWELAMLSP